MRKRIISGFAALFLLGYSLAAAAHSVPVEISGDNKYKSVRLAPGIYNAANSDLSDILIKDVNGENVPYFIHSGLQSVYADREIYPMELINSYVKDDSFYFDYKLADERENDIIATSVEFATANVDFAKAVDVYGSYDNVNWEFIQSDKIYAIDGKAKLNIDFLKPEKYTHCRIKLANNQERISFSAVNLVYSVKISEETYFIESLTPSFRVESADKQTKIIIDGVKNLRLRDITIDTGGMFKRTVTAPDGSRKELYNLELNGESYADTTIPLDRWLSPQESCTITIADNDDKPISINGVKLRYYADELVFEGASGGEYTLEFGADSSKTAPVYDIARYKSDILKGDIDRLEAGKINYITPEEPPQERDYRFAFNLAVIAVAVMLGAVILFKLRQK